MFYNDEDVQPMVDFAEQLLGKSGRMEYGQGVAYNICLATREFGKIWYGDTSLSDVTISQICETLGKRFGQSVYRVVDGFEFIPIYTKPLTS